VIVSFSSEESITWTGAEVGTEVIGDVGLGVGCVVTGVLSPLLDLALQLQTASISRTRRVIGWKVFMMMLQMCLAFVHESPRVFKCIDIYLYIGTSRDIYIICKSSFAEFSGAALRFLAQ